MRFDEPGRLYMYVYMLIGAVEVVYGVSDRALIMWVYPSLRKAFPA